MPCRDALSGRTHPEVEAVEGGVEVALSSQAVHLEGHLDQEETQEDELGERPAVSQAGWSWCTMATHSVFRPTRPSTVQ
ncbi:hypothetical protein EYF80_064758 [Liparis tanakae]|uniref:Uncharacterized protein n=1 Tax=Liparis tanakae TaxID=230148 RepID=A0A4Z2E9B2_9TELE|nr:hypothetical protein EYF80_064758 [Liparis tanakae]